MDTSSHLSIAQAAAVTGVTILNSILVLTSSAERTFVASRQRGNSPFATTGSLLWQQERVFYYLWLTRGALGIVACLLPLPAMWAMCIREQRSGDPGYAMAWAASALVACVAGSIVSERLLYIGFTDSLSAEQIACTVGSGTGVVLLIIGELVSVVPVPISWSVAGCALHRFSMIAWWYLVTSRAFSSPQFRARARITLGGHCVGFACVFLAFLPIFRTGLYRLFWLLAVFFAVELITTAQAVEMTYSNWVAENRRRSMPSLSPPSIDLGDHLPSRPHGHIPLTDIQPARHRDVDLEPPVQRTSDEIPLAFHSEDGSVRNRSPAPTQRTTVP